MGEAASGKSGGVQKVVTVHQENGTREYLIKSKILSIPEK
jgi:hypothetical protein